ncbi:MAG TPA: multidrug effflux MFS transporter [Rubrivivax sp.]|jgi:DHA1 family bicyclomycin/chloramphenicol resistance-like MFS transporter|nr:multidrug effflux MFS transporter [Rubrivivax sp.]
MSPLLIVTLLALLLGTQPITTDLYLPALPGLAVELRSPMGRTQLTLSALLLAFGLSQLLLGPMADRFGRRPVLLGGLSVYVVASAGSALAGDITALVAWRALQGVGMGAAVVCARAMVRDLYVPADGARVMSKALSGLGLIALASPLIGGLIASLLGWRTALAATGVFGAICLAMVALKLPETARRLNPQALQPGPMWHQWARILRHPSFVAWSLLIASTYAGLFAFLAASSFVFIDVLGSSRMACGLYLAGSSVCYIVGTFWCRRWLLRHGLAGAVKRGAAFTLCGGVSMAGLAWAGVIAPWAIFVPQFLYSFGHGVHQPCGQAAVVGPFPHHAGAASALAGFILAAAAVAVGAWLGVAMDGTVQPLTTTVGAMSVATALVAWTLVQRHGEAK